MCVCVFFQCLGNRSTCTSFLFHLLVCVCGGWGRSCASYGAAKLGRFLLTKSTERSACDVIDTSATPADMVDDVADTDFQTQNGSAHVCFRDFQTLSFNSSDHKLTERLEKI